MSDFERFPAECSTMTIRVAFGGFDFLHTFNNCNLFLLLNITKKLKYELRVLTTSAFCGMMEMIKRIILK